MTGPTKIRNAPSLPLRRASVRDASHSLRLFRPMRVAALFGVDPSTVWRWRKTGILPPPKQVGSVIGWTQEQLERVLNQRVPGDE